MCVGKVSCGVDDLVKYLDNMVTMGVVVMCVCVSRVPCGVDDLVKYLDNMVTMGVVVMYMELG